MYNTPGYFPFGPVNPVSGAAAINYDLDIYEAYPGLVLISTEPNGVYVAFREVDGCAWWVLNADFSTADLQWEQNSPQNPALPAYALEQCQDGTVNRYVAAATNTPGTALTWVLVWSMDALGNITQSPQTTTAANQVTLSLDPTWNSGIDVIMSSLEMNITDSSSSASSWLENYAVGDTAVWQVRKDGTLVTGKVPFSNVTGYVPPTTLNNATLTGTTTVTGPLDAENGITVTGAPGTFADGATVHNGLTVTGGETVDNLTVTSNETVDGNLGVNGNLNVGGTTTLNNLDVTGSITSSSPLTVVESTDHSITVTTPSSDTYNLSVNTGVLANVNIYGSNPSTTPGLSNPEVFTFTVPTAVGAPGYITVVQISSPSSGTTISGTITGGGFSTISAYETFTSVQSVLKTATCSNGTVVTITINTTPNPCTDYVQILITLYPL